jgi:hypothetical protein
MNEKWRIYEVLTETTTPPYEEVLNDHRIDEVTSEHFIMTDAFTQQEHPSKNF